MWKERNLLNSLLWEAAHDDMGIYPKAVVKAGVEVPRTEWQEGWNAAIMAMTQKYQRLRRWAEQLQPDVQKVLVELLDDDAEPLRLSYRESDGAEGGVELLLFCSDTFIYACSDSEAITLEELPEWHALWKAHGYVGTVAWISRKRSMPPVKEYRLDPAYIKAVADLPPRVPDGNPID